MTPSESDWRQVLGEDDLRDALEKLVLASPHGYKATAERLAPHIERAFEDVCEEVLRHFTYLTVEELAQIKAEAKAAGIAALRETER